MKVVKHSGHIVDFNQEKLKRSLLKSGAEKSVVDEVLAVINTQLHEGMTTKSIYKTAFGLLKKSSHAHAARYNLRAAIQMLGPAGFFFEKYIARLFVSEDYKAQTNLFLQGKCVTHEVDIAIMKNDLIDMVECKFHSGNDANSDVKIPMYILSRFNDLKDRKHLIFSNEDYISGCWIVTNNRFTLDALDFGNCSGLKLISWDYPEKQSLRKRIDEGSLYPVTCLTTLSLAEKDKLLVMDIILAREIKEHRAALEKIGLSSNRIKNVLKEVSELCINC